MTSSENVLKAPGCSTNCYGHRYQKEVYLILAYRKRVPTLVRSTDIAAVTDLRRRSWRLTPSVSSTRKGSMQRRVHQSRFSLVAMPSPPSRILCDPWTSTVSIHGRLVNVRHCLCEAMALLNTNTLRLQNQSLDAFAGLLLVTKIR